MILKNKPEKLWKMRARIQLRYNLWIFIDSGVDVVGYDKERFTANARHNLFSIVRKKIMEKIRKRERRRKDQM